MKKHTWSSFKVCLLAVPHIIQCCYLMIQSAVLCMRSVTVWGVWLYQVCDCIRCVTVWSVWLYQVCDCMKCVTVSGVCSQWISLWNQEYYKWTKRPGSCTVHAAFNYWKQCDECVTDMSVCTLHVCQHHMTACCQQRELSCYKTDSLGQQTESMKNHLLGIMHHFFIKR